MQESKIYKLPFIQVKYWCFNDKEIQDQYELHMRKLVNLKVPSKMRTDYLNELKLLNIGKRPFKVS